MGCGGSAISRVEPEIAAYVAAGQPKPLRLHHASDFHEKYLLGAKLGRGAFAQVRVTELATPDPEGKSAQPLAVKILDLRIEDPDDPEKKLNRIDSYLKKLAKIEAAIWMTVGKHANVVQLYASFYGDQLGYFVMEKCSSGLLSAMQNMPEITERGLGNIFAQMLTGITHCHSLKVIHRDIKPDNFLVGGEDQQTVKLSDFGLSAGITRRGEAHGIFGTAPYMCPEMLKGVGYDTKADVWSFGVQAYALLFGVFPYTPDEQNAKQMKAAILKGAPMSFMPANSKCPFCSSGGLSFLKLLLNRNPTERPTAEIALTDPWMQASIKGEYLPGQDLPSLRPTLRQAVKCGVFEARTTFKESPLDRLLQSYQFKHHGLPLPPPETPLTKEERKATKRQQMGTDSRNSSKTTQATDSSDDTTSTVFSGWSKGTDVFQSSSVFSDAGISRQYSG